MAEVTLAKRIEAIERRLKEAGLLPAVKEDATLNNIIICDMPFLLGALKRARKLLEEHRNYDPRHSDK